MGAIEIPTTRADFGQLLEGAARSVLSGQATGIPKFADGKVEMIRVLRVTGGSAMRAKIAMINQLHASIVPAPDELRGAFAGLTTLPKVRKAAALRPGPTLGTVEAATTLAIKRLARRYLELVDEIDAHLAPLVQATAPTLVAQLGIGVPSTAQLLVTAGDNPGRLRTEGSFEHLCGVPPLPKRYIAREVYEILTQDIPADTLD